MRRHPPSRPKRLEAQVQTGHFNKRPAIVEYGTAAFTIALVGTIYFFGGYGANSQLAAPKASYRDAQSEYAGPWIGNDRLTRLIHLPDRTPTP